MNNVCGRDDFVSPEKNLELMLSRLIISLSVCDCTRRDKSERPTSPFCLQVRLMPGKSAETMLKVEGLKGLFGS